MTEAEIQAQAEAVDAVIRAVARIDRSEFVRHDAGWRGAIGLGLVDSVFSMGARQHTATWGRGVHDRLQRLRSAHPEAVDDLQALVELGAERLRQVMGAATTARHDKADCVVDAARRLLTLDPPVRRAADARWRTAEVTSAYTGVRGLGRASADHFVMLLGLDGVRADRRIVRFVNAALTDRGLTAVPARQASRIVMAAHEIDDRGVGLTAYEHAIWRTGGTAHTRL